jgi:SulP family sulfate permease
VASAEAGKARESFEPKLVTTLREGYSGSQFLKDLFAGVTVGVVALPLAIAFAIASGVEPERGLYTAIVAGFVISALGGSRVQIGGPTGAFVVVVYGIVQQHGYDGLAVATLLAGLLLLLMAFLRLGSVIKFVPFPLTVGFTAGIALIIAASQLRDFFGLRMQSVPADFLEKLAAYARHLDSVNPAALGVGLASVAICVLWPRLTHRVPGPLVALLATTFAAQLLDLPVETIGDRFGRVPTTLPTPSIPQLDWTLIQQLFPAAFTIALLAAIESLLSATVADGMIGTRHRSNTELMAQGVANLASPLFGGIPATGAIARTASNIKAGGRTPVAGIVHALTLLLILSLFARWAEVIPLATLSGILLVVAWHMSELRTFARLFRSPRSDVTVMLVTFLLTVLIDLTVALEAGMVLAAFLFMRRMANLSQAGYVTRMLSEEMDPNDPNAISTRLVPPGVEVFEVYGSFFFGAASKFKDALQDVATRPRVLILRLREVLAIDATALHVLEDLFEKTRKDGTQLVLSGVHAQPLVALERSGLLARIGEENTHVHIDDALDRAREILGLPPEPRAAAFAPEAARDPRGEDSHD